MEVMEAAERERIEISSPSGHMDPFFG